MDLNKKGTLSSAVKDLKGGDAMKHSTLSGIVVFFAGFTIRARAII